MGNLTWQIKFFTLTIKLTSLSILIFRILWASLCVLTTIAFGSAVIFDRITFCLQATSRCPGNHMASYTAYISNIEENVWSGEYAPERFPCPFCQSNSSYAIWWLSFGFYSCHYFRPCGTWQFSSCEMQINIHDKNFIEVI